MARMHARRRGRSGSSPQIREKNPKWSPKPKEVEKEENLNGLIHLFRYEQRTFGQIYLLLSKHKMRPLI